MDLDVAVEAGVFAGKLYDALNARKIEVPPLRERVADIAPLAALLIREYGRQIGRNRMTLSTRAYERLIKYPWPGNVAELKGIARRLVLRAKKSRIEAGDVDVVLPTVAERVPLEEMSFEQMVESKLASFLRRIDGYPVTNLYDDVITRVERPLLELVMKSTGSNQVRAAEILGVNRNTLRRKLGEHDMLVKGKRKGTKAAQAKSRSRKKKTTRAKSPRKVG
jgi:two-component system nitrogen regulation response regulator GlnG